MGPRIILTLLAVSLSTIGLFSNAAAVSVGITCGGANTKDCGAAGYNEPNLHINICVDGGENGTCPTPNSNGEFLACKTNSTVGDPTCQLCKAYGQSCTQHSDCCSGYDKISSWPSPLKIFPFCVKTTLLGIVSPTSVCRPCIHDYYPCKGSNLPICRKLANPSESSATCQLYGGGSGGVDHLGHNPGWGFLLSPIALPDPCTPEANLSTIGGLPAPSSGTSDCLEMTRARKGQGYISEVGLFGTLYENSYFCSCPDSPTVGYSCQVTNVLKSALYNATAPNNNMIDNGQRCSKCGLKGNTCDPSLIGNLLNPKLPCCDYHTCVNKICVAPECTLEGNIENGAGQQTECCGAPTNFRNSKTNRCTDNKCGTVGIACISEDECCGALICLGRIEDFGKLKTCQNCIANNATGCMEHEDCCGWLGSTPYSFCYKREFCKECIAEGAECDDFDKCCTGRCPDAEDPADNKRKCPVED